MKRPFAVSISVVSSLLLAYGCSSDDTPEPVQTQGGTAGAAGFSGGNKASGGSVTHAGQAGSGGLGNGSAHAGQAGFFAPVSGGGASTEASGGAVGLAGGPATGGNPVVGGATSAGTTSAGQTSLGGSSGNATTLVAGRAGSGGSSGGAVTSAGSAGLVGGTSSTQSSMQGGAAGGSPGPQAGSGGVAGQENAGSAGMAGGPAEDPRCGTTSVTSTITTHLQITADNECDVYVNGEVAGQTTSWSSAVTLDVSLYVHPGRKNVVAVVGRNTSSQGGNDRGIIGQLTTTVGATTSTLLVTDHQWLVAQSVGSDWFSSNYDDSSWIEATEIASAGDGPWGNVFGSSSTAKWIWFAPVPNSTSEKPNLESTYARRTFYFDFDGQLSNVPSCNAPLE